MHVTNGGSNGFDSWNAWQDVTRKQSFGEENSDAGSECSSDGSDKVSDAGSESSRNGQVGSPTEEDVEAMLKEIWGSDEELSSGDESRRSPCRFSSQDASGAASSSCSSSLHPPSVYPRGSYYDDGAGYNVSLRGFVRSGELSPIYPAQNGQEYEEVNQQLITFIEDRYREYIQTEQNEANQAFCWSTLCHWREQTLSGFIRGQGLPDLNCSWKQFLAEEKEKIDALENPPQIQISRRSNVECASPRSEFKESAKNLQISLLKSYGSYCKHLYEVDQIDQEGRLQRITAYTNLVKTWKEGVIESFDQTSSAPDLQQSWVNFCLDKVWEFSFDSEGKSNLEEDHEDLFHGWRENIQQQLSQGGKIEAQYDGIPNFEELERNWLEHCGGMPADLEKEVDGVLDLSRLHRNQNEDEELQRVLELSRQEAAGSEMASKEEEEEALQAALFASLEQASANQCEEGKESAQNEKEDLQVDSVKLEDLSTEERIQVKLGQLYQQWLIDIRDLERSRSSSSAPSSTNERHSPPSSSKWSAKLQKRGGSSPASPTSPDGRPPAPSPATEEDILRKKSDEEEDLQRAIEMSLKGASEPSVARPLAEKRTASLEEAASRRQSLSLCNQEVVQVRGCGLPEKETERRILALCEEYGVDPAEYGI